MCKERIISYFTQIYYNIKFIFDVLSRKQYPMDEIDEDFNEFTDIDDDIEKDNVALLRQNRIHDLY